MNVRRLKGGNAYQGDNQEYIIEHGLMHDCLNNAIMQINYN